MCSTDIPDETINDKAYWLRGNLKTVNAEERRGEEKHKQFVLISAARYLRAQFYLQRVYDLA